MSLAHGLKKLAVVASSRRKTERSATLLGTAEGFFSDVGTPGHDFFDPDLSLPGERAFEQAQERGGSMAFEDAVSYALSGTGSSKRSELEGKA